MKAIAGKAVLYAFSGVILMAFFAVMPFHDTRAGFKEEGPVNGIRMKPADKVELITVYDNYSSNSDLSSGWGFGRLVKVDERVILFDTGGSGEVLLENMEKLRIKPTRVDTVVLSHIHGDHTGGLSEFLEENSDVKVWLPRSFPDRIKNEIRRKGAEYSDASGPAAIFPSVSTTGELGVSIKEQAMLALTPKGLVVITGCAHPGIVEIVKAAKNQTGEDIYLVIGGFHLGGASESIVIDIINSLKGLGVKKAAPCHCSGKRTKELFKHHYGKEYIDNGVGKNITIE